MRWLRLSDAILIDNLGIHRAGITKEKASPLDILPPLGTGKPVPRPGKGSPQYQKPRHAPFTNLGNKGDGKTLLDFGKMCL